MTHHTLFCPRYHAHTFSIAMWALPSCWSSIARRCSLDLSPVFGNTKPVSSFPSRSQTDLQFSCTHASKFDVCMRMRMCVYMCFMRMLHNCEMIFLRNQKCYCKFQDNRPERSDATKDTLDVANGQSSACCSAHMPVSSACCSVPSPC